MAHDFDTGLPLPIRSLVRAAVIARLAPLLRANGGYLQAVVPFARVIAGGDDTDGHDHAYQMLNGRAPAALVALGSKSYDATSATNAGLWQADLALQVVVFSNNARGLVDRLTLDPVGTADDQADPGIDVMLEHVAELLIGCDLGIGAKVATPRPVSEEHLATSEELSIWSINFAISVTADVALLRDVSRRIALIASTLTATTPAGTSADVVVDQETPIT